MSYRVTSIDRATLPAALLPLAKLHARVDYDDDDPLIIDILGRVIDLIERKTGQAIFASAAEWTPDSFDVLTTHGVLVPVQPVAAMTVEDADGNDVVDQYKLVGNRIQGRAAGLYLARVDGGAIPAGLVITMTLGNAAVTELVPAMVDSVMRFMAHLFANREAINDLLLRAADSWADDLISGSWVPRA